MTSPKASAPTFVWPNCSRADAGELRLGYATAAGNRELRQVIAARHEVAPDDVVITVGGIHALFLSAYILCGRGEEAIVATPVFPPARDALLSVGATLQTLPLCFDEGYRLDPAKLIAMLSPATRLVSLASPQNPSGVAIPQVHDGCAGGDGGTLPRCLPADRRNLSLRRL